MEILDRFGPDLRAHLDDVRDNLQLVADLAYGDVALAVPAPDGSLVVVADSRPMTAVAAVAASRVGRTLSRRDEPEAYEALASGAEVEGARHRSTRGIAYTTAAFPIGAARPEGAYGVLILDVTRQALESPGKMERAFMDAARGLIHTLCEGPLIDAASAEPFATTRRAGDGLLTLDAHGIVGYASPNAINILRAAGLEGSPVGRRGHELPGGAQGTGAALAGAGAVFAEVAVGERALLYRSVPLPDGVLVLVEDVTDARRRERELRVKEATIREVHHRVKNNLQTIGSLLRIQARRTGSPEAARALREAVERIGSMAVVHEQLTGSDDERVEFADSARIIVEMVRSGLAGPDSAIEASVEGTTGEVPAHVATSLALITAELVHNAIEHGLAARASGCVQVTLRRLTEELSLTVRDDGAGLPEGFDAATAANLGLAIVKTIVESDLKGTLVFSSNPRGTTVAIRVPLREVEAREG